MERDMSKRIILTEIVRFVGTVAMFAGTWAMIIFFVL
jgi:hypothetical protein